MIVNKKFNQFLAILIIVLSFGYIYFGSFWNLPYLNKELVNSTNDLLQNMLIWIVGFYFGASIKQKSE